jgi:hypothetical protein
VSRSLRARREFRKVLPEPEPPASSSSSAATDAAAAVSGDAGDGVGADEPLPQLWSRV